MSQNAHTLYLFFEDAIQLKTAQLVYQYLAAGNLQEAQRWSAKLGGAGLADLWDAQWFNQEVSPAPTHLRLRFDTGTHDGLPLRTLDTLFAHGLRCAVLEVFYDQVGETERMHFDEGEWVSRKAFFAVHPQWRAVVEPAQHSGADGADEAEQADDPFAFSKDPARPLPVHKLLQQAEKRQRDAQDAAEAFVELARTMGKGGKSPVQGLVAVLLLRAGFKGLVHAVLFTVVSVLLFKSFWLWMGLGLALAVALPLYYMLAEHKELRGDDSDDACSSRNNDPGEDGRAAVMAQP